MSSRMRSVELLCVCLTVVPRAESAAAQEVSTPSLEQVIVTAQRREQSLQDVPIAVSTVTAAQLRDSGISSTELLLTQVPALKVSRQSRGATTFIRGVGTSITSAGVESAVAIYIDGVYRADPTTNVLSFNNVSQVEVIKGPQGTLFGRNSTGGLINITTRDPSVDPSVVGSVSRANYEIWEGSLYASAGAGNFAADVALYAIDQGEGFMRNLVTGASISKLEDRAVRSKIRWTPSADDELTLIADWGENLTDIAAATNVYPSSALVGGFTRRGGDYTSIMNQDPDYRYSKDRGISLRYQHDFPSLSFSSLSAYRNVDTQYRNDVDAGPLTLAHAEQNPLSATLQQELLLTGSLPRLDWTAGVFVFRLDSRMDPLGIITSAAAAGNTRIYSKQITESQAIFGQATFALNEHTSVTAGLRWTRDDQTVSWRQVAGPGHTAAVGTQLAIAEDGQENDEPTWRLSLDRKLTPEVLAYVSYSRGYKSGNFNLSSVASPRIEPELLDAYEVGVKSELFERRLRLNAAVFHYQYDDIQLSRVLESFVVNYNAASGEVKGLDLEATFAPQLPLGELQLSTSLSVLDAEYTSFPNGPLSMSRPGGGNVIVSADLTGRTMVNAPQFAANAAVDYIVPIGSHELALRVNYFHSDGFYWEPDNRIEQKPYELVNAQLAYGFGSDAQYKVRLFGKNLTKAAYATYAAGGTTGDKWAPAEPRTYGIGLDFRF